MGSEALSEQSDSTLPEFDAESAQQIKDHAVKAAARTRFVVDSDEKIKALMEMPASEFFEISPMLDRNAGAPTTAVLRKAKKKKAATKHWVPRYKTDVFDLRVCIRLVFRSFPKEDFVELINFLLRGLEAISHGDKESFWHVDDPCFKRRMGLLGTNQYTNDLMEKMGFVKLGDVLWVWPHACFGDEDDDKPWGKSDLPPDCIGLDENRLDDVILLLKSCQRAMNTQGSNFKGHFKDIGTASCA